MSLFRLVHGSTQNASGWALLVPESQKRGPRVICVNLRADEPEASATRYAPRGVHGEPPGHRDAAFLANFEFQIACSPAITSSGCRLLDASRGLRAFFKKNKDKLN